MKYQRLLVIIILISSCSSTKHVVENNPNKTIEVVEVVKDTITKEVIIVEQEIKKTIEEDTIKKEITITKNKPNEFNQMLTKRFITTHTLWTELLQKHVSHDGNVDYMGFKKDHIKLINYFKVLDLNLQNETHSREEKLAYWINAYNAMTIDLILRNYPIKSIKDIKKPWDQRFWKLGEKWYNLNDIEHEILRKMDEPRIHFAIVCASYSCPKLQNEAFTAPHLDQQLTKATKEFLSDSDRNSITENNLKLSKIFQWFAKDFKQNGSLIHFLNQYSDIQISAKAKKQFKDYNWDLNE